jgi:osmoprotectant transport system substrate-binding protein
MTIRTLKGGIMRRIRVLALTLTFLLLLGACASSGGDPLAEGASETAAGEETTAEGGASEDGAAAGEGEGGTVTIGSANFAEQLILASMYAQVLENAGVTVEERPNLGNREIVYPAIETGEIDLLPEYTGALNAFVTGGEEAEDTSTEGLVASLQENLPEELTILEPSEAQDRDASAVTQETADEYGLQTLSDLAEVCGELVAGGPPEEETRYVGLPGLEEVYGCTFREFRPLDAGGPLTTEALNSGQIDVGRVFSTQGVIEEYGWVVLEDDKGLVPSENIIPLIRTDVLTDEVETVLNELSAALTTEDLIDLNRRVEIDQEDPETVAQEWLEEAGLLS